MHYELNDYEIDIFESYCPEVKRDAVRVFKTEDDQLIAELKDGSAVQYDLVMRTSRGAMSLDILLRPKKVNNEADFRKFLARKMYREMLRRGMDQVMLSELTGISQASVSKYMNAVSTPSAYNLSLIADTLRCTVDYLLTFDC